MTQKFTDFQSLGQHLGHQSSLSEKSWFTQEEKRLKTALLRAQQQLNKKSETITLTRLGKLYRDHKRYQQAIEPYEAALKIDPDNAYALDGLGVSYLKLGEYDKAITYFEKELEPTIPLNNLSRAYRFKGQYDRAMKYANKAIRKKPNDTFVMNELGTLNCLQGNYLKAIEWFEKMPSNKQAMNGLGITYRKMGNYSKAIECFNKQLKNDPEDIQTINGLGITYREMRNYSKAIDLFSKILKIDAKNIQAMDGLGITYRKMREYFQAIKWFEKKLDIDPRNIQAWNGLGITYREMGKYSEAIECFEKNILIAPQNVQTMAGLVTVYKEMNDETNFIRWCEEILTIAPTDKLALAGLTATFEKMGPIPKAVEPLKRRLQANHRDAYAQSQLYKIADQYVANRQLKEAQSITGFLKDIQEELHQIEEEKLFPASSDREKITADNQESMEEKVKRLETEIRQQEVMVLRTRQMAMVGMMTSGLDHEIMSPLQVILGNAQNCQTRIKRGTLDESKILNHLEKIIDATKWIDNVVSHLHVFSRNRKPNPVPVNVNVVIDNALSLFQQQLKARGIDIQKHLADNLPLVKADQTELEIVIINLINNARDALEGREDKRIIITTQARQSEVQIRVEDNGEGIQPDQLPRIFEPFFTTKEKGAGIGLYTTQQIVQAYNGDINVSSHVNQMTTFLITFPGIPEKEIT